VGVDSTKKLEGDTFQIMVEMEFICLPKRKLTRKGFDHQKTLVLMHFFLKRYHFNTVICNEYNKIAVSTIIRLDLLLESFT